MNIYLYGPPCSGKTSLGQRLAQALDMAFIDLDSQIERTTGKRIAEIFGEMGEVVFRQQERLALNAAVREPSSVVALGGGALLDPSSRALVESTGVVLTLYADPTVLLSRLGDASERPLLAGDPASKLAELLARRNAHYESFVPRLNVSHLDLSAAVWEAQCVLGMMRLHAMGAGSDMRVMPGCLDTIGLALRDRSLDGPVAVVSDVNVAPLYLERVLKSLHDERFLAFPVVLPAGEGHKTISTVQTIWSAFVQGGLDRGSTILALGGGVVGDMTGFAAATFLRGLTWVNLPTTLLAMVDSSLGGKTGVDLPQAKNLVGAFHPPALIWSDPSLLQTLPAREMRSGMAEVLKHGVIGDAELFQRCSSGFDTASMDLAWIVPRAAAGKARIIEIDPYEKGIRQVLNFGHTIGHGVEIASNYTLSHGEAVAIGMVIETRLAENLGIAEKGLTDTITQALRRLGLPTEIPTAIDRGRIIQAVGHDKKRASGQITFALPVCIGEVQTGIIVEHWEDAL